MFFAAPPRIRFPLSTSELGQPRAEATVFDLKSIGPGPRVERCAVRSRRAVNLRVKHVSELAERSSSLLPGSRPPATPQGGHQKAPPQA